DFFRLAHDRLDGPRRFAAAAFTSARLLFTRAAANRLQIFGDAIPARLLVRRAGDVVRAARLWRLPRQPRAEDQVRRLVAHAGHHLLEVRITFLLERDARVALGERLQPDAALQRVHRVQVVLPALVENLDQDEL